MIKVICWNIDRRHPAVQELLEMDADVALLQEVGSGAHGLLGAAGGAVAVSPHDPWEPAPQGDYDRWPLVVKLSDRVRMEWFRPVRATIPKEQDDEMAVSCAGTIAVARVIPLDGGEPFIAASIYARWFGHHPATESDWIYSDAAAHHIISDLSAFVGSDDPSTHRILAAGDLNNIYGATEENDLVWFERDRTVFNRMDALGLEFMGPQYPNGRQAEPAPIGLEHDTKNVPTYIPGRGRSPASARNQLDYVFASRGFHESIRTRALNEVDEWGSSDHCRILIEVGE